MAKKTSDLTAGGVHPGQFLKNDVQYRAPIFQRHRVNPEAQGRPAEGATFASAAVISVVIG